MISLEYWVKENKSFYDCDNGVVITWKRKYDEDLYQMSKDFFSCAYRVTEDIVQEVHNIVKYDMWFLPCVYMFRQSIELILKALVARRIDKRHEFEVALSDDKHDLAKLFNRYIDSIDGLYITEAEKIWIQKYLDDIELVDSSSTLFRYPFKDEFISRYNNDFLDICEMGNSLLNAYAILSKEYNGIADDSIYEIETERDCKFLIFASDGFGNCQLWDSPWGDGFHKQVEGYSDVAEFIYEKYKNESNQNQIFPMFFLLRNAIEISLKRLLFSKVIHGVDLKKIRRTRNSHSLKELWNAVNDMVRSYANEHGEDLQYLDYLESGILELDDVDKKGDVFRYPFNYNLQYRFDGQRLDVDNVFDFMAGIFNILDGCSGMLTEIADYEAEMLYEMQTYAW